MAAGEGLAMVLEGDVVEGDVLEAYVLSLSGGPVHIGFCSVEV